MALLSLRNVSLAFGGPKLLDQVNLEIEPGERVCLLGRNGEGKSRLLRLIRGEIQPDEGQVLRQQGLRVSLLPQDVPGTVRAGSTIKWPRDWTTENIPIPGQTTACGRSSREWGSTPLPASRISHRA